MGGLAVWIWNKDEKLRASVVRSGRSGVDIANAVRLMIWVLHLYLISRSANLMRSEGGSSKGSCAWLSGMGFRFCLMCSCVPRVDVDAFLAHSGVKTKRVRSGALREIKR